MGDLTGEGNQMSEQPQTYTLSTSPAARIAQLDRDARASAEDAQERIREALTAAWEAGVQISQLAEHKVSMTQLLALAEESGVPVQRLHAYLRVRRRHHSLETLLEGGARQLALFDEKGEPAEHGAGDDDMPPPDAQPLDLRPILDPIGRGVGRYRKALAKRPLKDWDSGELERAWAHLRGAKEACEEIEAVIESRRNRGEVVRFARTVDRRGGR
jgi:hypothetical protein